MAIQRLPTTGDVPRSTGVPASLVPGGDADSAGFPWEGRTFDHHVTAFADDDGTAPEQFRAAVQALREAADLFERGSGSRDSRAPLLSSLASAQADALLALSKSRVLIPLLTEAGELGVTPEGKTVEKTQELSIVTVQAADGRRVMPVFSSVDTMRVWNPGARPIPVPAPQAAIAAAHERTDLIIVDPGSPECEFGVRRTQLEALAIAERVVAPWADAAVKEEFASAAHSHPDLLAVELAPGDPQARLLEAETDVVLTLRPGLQRDRVGAILLELQASWAASETVVAKVDSLRVRLQQ